MLAHRLSQCSRFYVRSLQVKQNVIAPLTHVYARGLTTTSGSSNKDSPPVTNPISSLLSIVKTFNIGLQKLKSDFLTSLYIKEAEQTRSFLRRKLRLQYEQRRNKLRLHEKHGIHIVVQKGAEQEEVAFLPSTVHSHVASSDVNFENNDVPEQKFYASSNYLSTRRPQEQLRQISRDLQVTLPTVAAFVFIPFVGYSFLLLGMMFPRLLLSRQFHTKQQREHFAAKEYGERRAYFDRLNADFWGRTMRTMPGLILINGNNKINSVQQDRIPQFLEPLTYYGMDSGGPILTESSIDLLYNLLVQDNSAASISTLQDTHIHSLSLVNNLAAPLLLPSNLSPLFLQTCLPTRYLQNKLTNLAEDIIMDDAALIEEGQIDIKCSGMTEEEVLDACWMRGLPVGRFVRYSGSKLDSGAIDEVNLMRSTLANHLQMMKYAHRSVGTVAGSDSRSALVRDKALQLLILHFPAIRYQLMMESKQ